MSWARKMRLENKWNMSHQHLHSHSHSHTTVHGTVQYSNSRSLRWRSIILATCPSKHQTTTRPSKHHQRSRNQTARIKRQRESRHQMARIKRQHDLASIIKRAT